MKFKLSAQIKRESDILSQVIDYLRYEQNRGRIVWFARCNGGSAVASEGENRRFIRFYNLYLRSRLPDNKGMADIHGQLPGGRYFAIECKRYGEPASKEQLIFMDEVRVGGGIAAVVHNFLDAKSVLFGEIDVK